MLPEWFYPVLEKAEEDLAATPEQFWPAAYRAFMTTNPKETP